MVENPPPIDIQLSPEFPTRGKPTALQARLFMGGEAMKYKQPLDPIKAVTEGKMQEEHDKNRKDTLSKLGICATYEGHLEWSQGEKAQMQHDEQVNKWVSDNVATYADPSNRIFLNALSEIKSLGGIDISQIDAETSRQIYHRYFTNSAQTEPVVIKIGEDTQYIPANVECFIKDMIDAHKVAGAINYQSLENHLTAITYMAGMFGQNTSALLKEYMTALIKFNKNPQTKQEFISDINTKASVKEIKDGHEETHEISRIDWLNTDENRLMKWYHETTTGTRIEPIDIYSKIVINIPHIPGEPTGQDWEKLKAYYNHYEAERSDWKNALQIRKAFVNSEITKENPPVYYPGAAVDIERPLIFTDATHFIFVDPLYVNADSSLNADYLPDKWIEKIGGKIIGTPKIEGEFGMGGKRIIDFEWNGKNRQIVMYAADATKISPKELEKGTSFVILGGRPAAGSDVGNLISSENYSRLYQTIKTGGFINRTMLKHLPPELIGLQTIIQSPPEGIDTYSNGFPLVQKTTHESDYKEFFKIDDQIDEIINVRGGKITNRILPETYSDYENSLRNLKKLCDNITDKKRRLTMQSLKKSLLPDAFSEREIRIIKRFGKEFGLVNDEKIQEYLTQLNATVLKVFPELTTPSTGEIPISTIKEVNNIIITFSDEKPEPIVEIVESKPIEVSVQKTKDVPNIQILTIDTLLPRPSADRIQNLPELYHETAQQFCTNLRNILVSERGQLLPNPYKHSPPEPGEKEYLLEDRQSGIGLEVNKKEEARDNDFFVSGFANWSLRHHLPVAINGPGHATLIVKGPEQIMEEGKQKWVIKVYDPLRDGVRNIDLKEQKSFKEWLNENIKTGKIEVILNVIDATQPPKYRYILPKDPNDLEVEIVNPESEKMIYLRFLQETLPFARTAIPGTAWDNFYNGTYDLTLNNDPNIPKEVVERLFKEIQHDGKNCIPMSFIKGAMLYTLSPGNADEKKEIVRQIYDDFGVKLYTRDELLEEAPFVVLGQAIIRTQSEAFIQDLVQASPTLEEQIQILKTPNQEIPEPIRITAQELGISLDSLKYKSALMETMSIQTNSRSFASWCSEVRKKIIDANDIRISYNGARYNQWKLPIIPGKEENVLQFREDTGYFDADEVVRTAGDRYGLPVAIYALPDGHAQLVLKVEKVGINAEGIPTMTMWLYDPLASHPGDRMVTKVNIEGGIEAAANLDPNDPQYWDTHFRIWTNKQARDLLKKSEYNLTLTSDPFYLVHDDIKRLKETAYQYLPEGKGNNCVPYCFLMAMSRWAAKYNKDDPDMPPELRDFFDRGLEQFSKDWSIPVRESDGSTKYYPFHITTRDDFEKVVDPLIVTSIIT